MMTPKTIPVIATAAVAGSDSAMISATDRPGWDVDSPRSPRSSPCTYRRNCSGIDLSRFNCSRRTAAASGVYWMPSMTLTGSPGMMRTSRNTSTTTTAMVKRA
jgi:hypothetical protein